MLFVYDFNRSHAPRLVEGPTPEQALAPPGGLVNHVTPTIGHPCVTSNVALMEVGVPSHFPAEWTERFFGCAHQPLRSTMP